MKRGYSRGLRLTLLHYSVETTKANVLVKPWVFILGVLGKLPRSDCEVGLVSGDIWRVEFPAFRPSPCVVTACLLYEVSHILPIEGFIFFNIFQFTL